jgi:hypothetical protein
MCEQERAEENYHVGEARHLCVHYRNTDDADAGVTRGEAGRSAFDAVNGGAPAIGAAAATGVTCGMEVIWAATCSAIWVANSGIISGAICGPAGEVA